MDRNVFDYLSKKGYKFARVSHENAGANASAHAVDACMAEPGVAENAFKQSLKTISETLTTYSRWFDRSILRLSSEEYRRAFWREASLHGYTIGPMPRTYNSVINSLGVTKMQQASAMFWVEMMRCSGFPLWLFFSVFTPKVVHKLFIADRKAFNNEKERLRRLQLRADRIAVKIRRTVNPKPSLQSIREAYEVVRNLRKHPEIKPYEAALKLGFLLEDLERYVDNHVIAIPGKFGAVGRAGGIKRLFQREAPDLFDHYTAIMRYKAIAKKFRQSCGAADPIPADALLRDSALKGSESDDTATSQIVSSTTHADSVQTNKYAEIPPKEVLHDCAQLNKWMGEHGNTAYLKTQDWVSRAEIIYTDKHLLNGKSLKTAGEVLDFCDGSIVSLEASIALKIDPDCIVESAEEVANLKSSKLPYRIKKWFNNKFPNPTCVA